MGKKKIIVTGGTGFIGSHTVVELLESGYQVVIFDNLSNSKRNVLDNIFKITGERPQFEYIDVSREDQVKRAFEKHTDAKAVIHFAALKAVGESVAKPLEYYRNNIFAILNVLNEMRNNEIINFIFSSSATVYGQPEELPATESSPVIPAISPYGQTKQIGENILRDAVMAYEGTLLGISLRYFNPIGAHPSALIGELPMGYPFNLMPHITQTAAGIRGPVKVFGSDYDTADGTAVRDYIHVVDVAQAHVVSVKRLLQKEQEEPYEVFNIGTGNGFTVLQVIQSFERTSGLKLDYEIVGRRPGDAEKIYAGTRLALEKLGWQTKYSLDDMTKTAWAWEQNLRKSD
jgi:UDP-glucose 4-epimerase